ncbi:diacylglycerol kinase family protein [Sporosarcina sp. G11-34]|uniref:diacylglycerol kinase family protein n=1 Tax=Sporosarcina sp. G11-34 TaxID=2849605 RepID=UPI0022A99FEC|nr:diacylglycerol kinase family protein [Sporosarcina sp. G11-34]MCZ2259356.1 diacylglycerol kinase family protein [Sporosarcina sp. G11-34]
MRKYLKAFGYAFEGILHGVKTERHLKFHVFSAIVVIIAGFLTGLSLIEWLIILVLIGGMLSLELVNSAVERIVDLVTTEKHPLAKQAKDLAAGAVLIYAISSALIGLFIFVPKWFI